MAGKPKRILFISHEASISGGTFVLLELMKWAKLRGDLEMSLLLKEDGPVKQKFEEVCPVYLYKLPDPQLGNRFYSSVYRRFIGPQQRKRHQKNLLDSLQKLDFDLIYANTVATGEILNFLSPLQRKVVCHVHELQFVIDCLGAENMKQVIENTSMYIAGCAEVKNNLVEHYQIKNEMILVLPELVNFEKVDAEKRESNVRAQLGIAEQSFVVGGSGSVEWRKGVDLFVEVAVQVIAEIPSAHFIWVCTPRQTDMATKLDFDIKKAGLEKNIRFVGLNEPPYRYYRIFNLFLLTSREDPYPLVCIENMYLNNPVICFEQSGGAVSLIKRYQFGKSVPYLNTAIMAQGVIEFIRSKEAQFHPIDKMQLKTEHAVETIGPKIFEAISNL